VYAGTVATADLGSAMATTNLEPAARVVSRRFGFWAVAITLFLAGHLSDVRGLGFIGLGDLASLHEVLAEAPAA
jgi:hypothetical protein